jgi:hypothetical protein
MGLFDMLEDDFEFTSTPHSTKRVLGRVAEGAATVAEGALAFDDARELRHQIRRQTRKTYIQEGVALFGLAALAVKKFS